MNSPYKYMGASYQYLPQNILQSLMVLHSRNKNVDYKKILSDIETCIKEEYEKDKRLLHEPWLRNTDRTKNTLKILFDYRKMVLKRLFVLSEQSFDSFKEINANLLDLHDRMVDKMTRLYSSWLTDEEEGWENDCNVCGKIIVEQTKDDYPDDGSGSDYEWMMERIEELNGNDILTKEFSGAPDICCDKVKLGLEHDRPNTFFSFGGEKPFGDFLMCRAFRCLCIDSPYAPQDILRIKYFWCDVSLTHQRIINHKGELQ